MHRHIIDSDDSIMIDKEAGETSLRDKVPLLHVSVDSMHLVNISDSKNSCMTIHPLRLSDGTLRPRVGDSEPEFHEDAHYLIRIATLQGKDRYHQLDIEGNYLG
jgi:hypothetical protein